MASLITSDLLRPHTCGQPLDQSFSFRIERTVSGNELLPSLYDDTLLRRFMARK
jgi:hypothetical protein